MWGLKRGRSKTMPRVVPSQVVAVIEQLFPEVISGLPFSLNSDQAEATRALLTKGVRRLQTKQRHGYFPASTRRASGARSPTRWAGNHAPGPADARPPW